MYAALGATLLASALPSTAPAPALPSCVSQAVHDQSVKECQNLTVKGIGLGVVGYEQFSACALAKVPVCVRYAAPVSVARPPLSVSTVASAFRQLPTGYQTIPTTPIVPAPPDKKNLVIGGILAVLVIGGGVVAYKTFKKKG